MPIHPLPQFEADVADYEKSKRADALREHGIPEHEIEKLSEDDRKTYEALKAPTQLVVRFGSMKLVGEFKYKGDAKPGCGSKLVVRTHRGHELGEMLTSTCPNAGCSKSVSRKEMLDYIDNSGGRQYPFYTDGRVLRIASTEDLDRQAALTQEAHGFLRQARDIARQTNPEIKLVEAEPILGGERLSFYYTTEHDERNDRRLRPDTRELHGELTKIHHPARIELRQIGARDEARLVADYEKCGQYCCCKNFLKVLKPVSMKSAKVQKATLDPLKISGRCGRLMCCLRYEDETYDELRKRLPHRKSRVGTPEGDGIVIETQILTQLALVELDESRERVAIPVEDLTEPGAPRKPKPEPKPAPAAVVEAKPKPERRSRQDAPKRETDEERTERRKKRRERRKKKKAEEQTGETTEPAADQAETSAGPADTPPAESGAATDNAEAPSKKKKRRRRRRKRGSGEATDGGDSTTPEAQTDSPPAQPSTTDAPAEPIADPKPVKKKRRRRRRRSSGDGESPPPSDD